MRAITTDELGRWQGAHEAAMWDTCHLVTRVENGVDAYGRPVVIWQESATDVACGLDLRNSYEVLRGAQVWQYDARLRLPIATVVTSVDRVIITKRHGVALDAEMIFDVIGEPRRGPSGLLLELKTLTDGSVT